MRHPLIALWRQQTREYPCSQREGASSGGLVVVETARPAVVAGAEGIIVVVG